MQENPEIKEENINRYSCPNCGADRVFDPKIGKLACPYCGYQEEIQTDSGEIAERDFQKFLRPENQRLQPLAVDAMQVSCDSCGATVTFIPPETARQCDFCAAKIVAQPKSADPLVAPEGVLPFAVTNQAASASLSVWISSRWFAPNDLKKFAEKDKINSIYLPFWTYDADSSTRYSGKRGEDYQERSYYKDSEGKRRETSVTKTRWFSASGRVSRFFDDVHIPASVSVLPDYIGRLDWNFQELVAYEPAFLAGHKAQTYQVTLEEGFEKFKAIADGIIRNDVRHDIGGDRQQIDSLTTNFSNVTFKHVLLPVYAGAYRFNGKIYQILVNGKTGEVMGERPYSKLKIGCLVVSIIFLIIIVLLIYSTAR